MALRRVTDPALIGEHLRRLTGSWEGSGRGRFPTIETFDYRETFRANVRKAGEGTLHFEQQTWRVVGGDGRNGDGEVLHWESGFLVSRDDGKVELLNAQESRRVEVLVGDLFVEEMRPTAWVLRLVSVVQAHDARMLATTREIRLDDHTLSYAVAMATTAVPDIQPHLTGSLTRVRES